MSANDNLKTIQSAYEAFGRGDIPALLEILTDDVDWAAEASSTSAPWYGVQHDPAEVGKFFEKFGAAIEVTEFTPVSMAANDTDVLAVIQYRGHARDTGTEFEMHLHHYFKLRDGKVYYYRGSEDTEQTATSLRG